MARLNGRAIAGAALALAAVALPIPTAPAASASTFVSPAPAALDYKVTMVARQCDEYTDVFANRARNDIMESLRDLGPGSPYNPFVAIQPSVEDGLAPQTSCRPLPSWTFTFGTGIARPVPGTNLSYVTGASTINRQVTTQASVPLLDNQGNPTGQTIAGASTFTLTSQELQLASQSSRFWVMGGTPTQPLNGRGADFGFAAIRCAKDDLNGDNVEWIGYPSGFRHVFCYAFYVQPPPGAGRIIIEKQILAPSDASTPFDFGGTTSFNENGEFTIAVPPGPGGQSGAVEFIRGETRDGDDPWTVRELIPDGFELVDIRCSSAEGGSDWSFSGQNPNGPDGVDTVSIFLAEGDTVRCTFVNDVVPPPEPGDARIVKLILGPETGFPLEVLPATWDFAYRVEPDDPEAALVAGTLQLAAVADNPSADSGIITGLPPGDWTLVEELPEPAPGWYWEFVRGGCDVYVGESVTRIPAAVTDAGPTVTGRLEQGASATCVFANRLVPTGGLVVRLTTLGGTGTFGFAVEGADNSSTSPVEPEVPVPSEVVAGSTIGGNGGIQLTQSATTVTAGPSGTTVASGDSTNPLIGTWNVTPIAPADSAAGRWVIEGTPGCNLRGAPVVNIGPEIMRVQPGNAASPVLTCDWTYRLIPPSTLDLVKVIAGDPAGQGSNVVITAACSDGSRAQLEVAPGAASPARLPAPLSFLDPVSCQVAETSAGVADGASVVTSSRVLVDGAVSTRPPSSLPVGGPNVSEAVDVEFTNTYTAAPPVTSAAPPSTLPPTGSGSGTGPTLVLALGMLGLGAVVLGASRLRRSE